MTATTIVDFLRARLDEDERTARAVPHQGPFVITPGADRHWIDSVRDNLTVALVPLPAEALAKLIARHDPSRVLADVAAKRALIDAAAQVAETIDGEIWCSHRAEDLLAGASDNHLGGTDPIPPDCEGASVLRRLLGPLVAPYASHPDCQQEWVPSGAAAAEHGLSGVDAPNDDARATINKIVRVRGWQQ